jgi:hypothetical protein
VAAVFLAEASAAVAAAVSSSTSSPKVYGVALVFVSLSVWPEIRFAVLTHVDFVLSLPS